VTASDPPRGGRQPQLRVALLAGGLGKGGAEKQLVYMAQALAERGADVRVYSLTSGEFYESRLATIGVPVIWVGRRELPALRLLELAHRLRSFRPHVVHSAHFYVNLYAALVAPLCGGVGIGSLRNDVRHELEANGVWGRWLLRQPRALLANSYAARRNAEAFGADSTRIRVLPNVIDFPEPEPSANGTPPTDRDGVVILGVARLVPAKRLERFLAAVALARNAGAPVRAIVVGDGPERQRLHEEARALGLLPDGVTFAGHRDDVAAELAGGHVLLLTSDHEGFPNVLLEAMAAGLPVVTTPAGDAGLVVEDGTTGYVVPFDAIDGMAQRLVELARSPELRAHLGAAGRERAWENYAYSGLANRLLEVYEAFARQQGRQEAVKAAAVALHRAGANG
jgi:glycosyltransferase involved in cell wall biosynthesis